MKKLFDLTFSQKEDIQIDNSCIGELLLSVTGTGEFEGDQLKGQLVPVGMGITTSPYPGKNNIKVSMLLRTNDGADILMNVDAIFDIDYNKEAKMAAGEYISPEDYYYKGTVDFKTGSERYKWLERKICVCSIEILDWSHLKITTFMV